MSNMSKLMLLFALLKKVPITEHLGKAIRENASLKSFVIPLNTLPLFTALCINNRDGPIIGLANYLELNLKDNILIVSFEGDIDFKIPLDDLICMKIFSYKEAMMVLNEQTKKTKVEGTKCPIQNFGLKSVLI